MFKITAEDGNARIGKLKTRHGTIETPFFMPVATRAVGKYIGSEDYKKLYCDQEMKINDYVKLVSPLALPYLLIRDLVVFLKTRIEVYLHTNNFLFVTFFLQIQTLL